MNKIVLVGNIGKDPELKQSPNGIPMTILNIGCQTSTTEKDTIWYRCIGWGERYHKLASSLQKGQQLIIAGELTKANAYLSKQTQEPKVGLEVKIENISFGKPPKKQSEESFF